jgi:hypothetical protein
MQSTGVSLTSRIESRRYDLVKFILVAYSRSTEHVLETTNNVGSLPAAKIEGGLSNNPYCTNSFFRSGISRLARPHTCHALVAISQPAGVLELAKLERRGPQSR